MQLLNLVVVWVVTPLLEKWKKDDLVLRFEKDETNAVPHFQQVHWGIATWADDFLLFTNTVKKGRVVVKQ